MRDKVFYEKKDQIVDFAFDEDVVAVFPDMIRRSVPGYEVIVPMTGLLAARHLGASGTAFDLGCSLGASTLAILKQTDAPIRIVGIDSSEPMIEQARASISDSRASFVCCDARAVDVSGANVIVMNFVMQFMPPEERLAFLSKLRSQMAPDGMLLVSEKVREIQTTIFANTHLAWKKANGYSDLELSQKRTALENVMRIDSEDEHHERFRAAGFNTSIQWFRCLNWASFIVQPGEPGH